ncbi:MAG: replication-associated recombination protein A [Elusimicrobiaceae bacterium]|nr:replication-associated recombination protein A [Elusimicrobiaceae bacterium]
MREEKEETTVPLAARQAPKKLEDFAGQPHLLGEGKMLRRLLEADMIKSAVFFGPPGCGKTATARFIASRTQAYTVELNAAAAGVADIKKVLAEAKDRARTPTFDQKRTLVILDEIHHFNKTQQDVLLPSVERGDIILIGITTENPYFYINTALLSRFSVFEFKALNEQDLLKILHRAAQNEQAEIDDDAAEFFVTQANGDSRKMLNAAELAFVTTKPGKDGFKHIDLQTAQECIQRRHLNYDKKGDEHYDIISAFIKSMRGSDPDAAVYWLARMLESGEDPRFIARRILICASEDVGLAEPAALMIAQAAFSAAEELGMPEVRIPLAHAAIYVACCPKSNSAYLAVDAALNEVREGRYRPVPDHLRSGGKNRGYKYAHDFPNHYVKQMYMPYPKKFFEPGLLGKEPLLIERLKKIKGE